MSDLAVAVVASLAAAACYAAGAVLQERTAARGAFGQGLWWLSLGLNGTGGLLHTVALRLGPLGLVQSLGALSVLLAVPLGAASAGTGVPPRRWCGAALTTIGLTVLVLVAPTSEGKALGLLPALGLTGIAVAVLAALVACARAIASPAGRSLVYAAAAGIAFAVTSALVQTLTIHPGALLSPVTPAAAGLAIGGVLLSQAGYRGSGLGAPLATATIVNPIVAAAIGAALLGERYGSGAPAAALAGTAAMVAAGGVALLVQADRRRVTHVRPRSAMMLRRPRRVGG